MKTFFSSFSLSACLLALFFFCPSTSALGADDTMLMFVGEDLSVVTAASRVPESPSSAPAVVDVVTRQTIEKRGYRTLAQLLSYETGFYISNNARGSVPYLRGLPGSILLLIDGIPMPSGGTKNIHPLDHELSLHNVKQVEIIRGPGSVLWGGDAFAGIVNVVPLTAKDSQGVTTRVSAGSNHEKEAYASAAMDREYLEAFFSVRAATRRYHDPDYNKYSVGERGSIDISEQTLEDSEYFELVGNGRINDWLTFSGRFSDFTRKYSVEEGSGLKWEGTREAPVSSIGLSANHTIGKSHLKVSAYYQNLSFDLKDMDTEHRETLDQYYGEVLWDRRFFKKGLLTAGVSAKESRVTGALAQGGFDPDAVLTPFAYFEQDVEQTDYTTRVKSLFSQYRHQFGSVRVWAGARVDSHSAYSTNTSWNMGINWDASDDWRFKAIYGTGYRTPYSQQVFEGITEQSDEIDTYSLQARWKPDDRFSLDLTTFYSSVYGYVSADPYAGVSEPVSSDIFGAELSAKASLGGLNLFLNLSGTESDGEDYLFQVKDYSVVEPDGSVTVHYDTWQEPFDTAPPLMVKAGMDWRINRKTSLSVMAKYTDDILYSYTQDTISGTRSDFWTVDASFTFRDFLVTDSEMSCGVKNATDRDRWFSGYYGPVPGEGRTWFVQWSKKW